MHQHGPQIGEGLVFLAGGWAVARFQCDLGTAPTVAPRGCLVRGRSRCASHGCAARTTSYPCPTRASLIRTACRTLTGSQVGASLSRRRFSPVGRTRGGPGCRSLATTTNAEGFITAKVPRRRRGLSRRGSGPAAGLSAAKAWPGHHNDRPCRGRLSSRSTHKVGRRGAPAGRHPPERAGTPSPGDPSTWSGEESATDPTGSRGWRRTAFWPYAVCTPWTPADR